MTWRAAVLAWALPGRAHAVRFAVCGLGLGLVLAVAAAAPGRAGRPLASAASAAGPSASSRGDRETVVLEAPGGEMVRFADGSVIVATPDHMLRIDLVGALPVAPVSHGAAAAARGAAAALEEVTYPGVWDGVTLDFEARAGAVLKSSYRIEAGRPGNPVGQIRLRYNRPVGIDGRGNLVIRYANGTMTESAPVAWQVIDGRKVPVRVSYRQTAAHDIGFALGDYDHSRALVIDPTLTWSTFLGAGVANHNDYGQSIAVDGSGNVYVAGMSNSTWGSPVRAYTGGYDAFVAKLAGDGSLTWNSFLGSASDDNSLGIAVDGSGNAYVSGYSNATWGSPVRAFTNGGGSPDAFVAKVSSSGSLTWSTFLGGAQSDYPNSIAVDGSNNVYVAGYSTSTWGSPVRAYSSGEDAFAAELTSAGALTWNTFLGGSGTDDGYGVTVDSGGTTVYVTGRSSATWGSPLRAYNASFDAFTAKLNGSGALSWSTFLGGSAWDEGNAVALDGSGNVYVAGYASGTWGSPVAAFGGTASAAVSKLNSSGNLLWNTFYAGSSTQGKGIVLDGSGGVYIVGNSGNDAFAVALDSSGNFAWSTPLGGTGTDTGDGIAIDGNQNVLVTGTSNATWGSPVRAYGASFDAYVAKIPPGTLSLRSSPSLFWSFVATGYDQWASASAAPLTGCVATGTVTHCGSGAAPMVEVVDTTGSGAGWSVSEYLSGSTLPAGSQLRFNGAGSGTYGWSQVSPIATDPFAGATPANVCDFGSSCTAATPASACAHAELGFSSCPTYPVTMGGADATHQVNLYSAQAASGLGSICLASGTATGTGCAGATATGFFNLGIKGTTAVGSTSVTINLAVNSGP